MEQSKENLKKSGLLQLPDLFVNGNVKVYQKWQ